MDCSTPGSSVHGILQARILKWVVISFSMGSSHPRGQTWVSSALQADYLPSEPPGKYSEISSDILNLNYIMRFVCFVLFFKIWYYYGFKCISHCALRWNFYYNQENFLHLFFIVHMWKLPLLCTMSFSVSSLIQHFFNSDLLKNIFHMTVPYEDTLLNYYLECELQLTAQFSHSVMYDSLQPQGLLHARPPCLSPNPGAHSNSCPLSRWCHPTISSSVVPFCSRLQSFPASGSSMNQFLTSGGQSIVVSASASVLPMNIQDWFPLGWTGWISL